MVIKFKKESPDAVLPAYAEPGAAGMDCTARSIELSPNGFIEYALGFSVEIPDGYVGLLYPRSSISKLGLTLANSVGVIDSSYRGEVKMRFKKISGAPAYEPGERVGQLMIVPYPKIQVQEVTELSTTERGTGAFGSTGK